MTEAQAQFRVCFVCTGNICRSPMAEVVFQSLIDQHGYGAVLAVDSAGTGDWHVGEAADPRTMDALRNAGYDPGDHRARQFDPAWFPELDLVIALDHGQERALREQAPSDADRAKIHLLRSFDPEAEGRLDVPDPYYSDQDAFALALAQIERATTALFRQIEPGIRPGVA